MLEITKNEDESLLIRAEFLPENVDFKKTVKVNWIADHELSKVILVEYDHLLREKKVLEESEMPFEKQLNEVTKYVTEAIGEPSLQDLKKGQFIQLERRGYFRVDNVHIEEGRNVPELIFVPDGKSKGMSTITKNVANK